MKEQRGCRDHSGPVRQFPPPDPVSGKPYGVEKHPASEKTLLLPSPYQDGESRGIRWKLTQQRVEIEGLRKHREIPIGRARPFRPGTVPIQLDAVLIGIAKVDSLAHSVVARSLERDSGIHTTTQRIGQSRSRRIKNGQMVKPRGPCGRRGATKAFPCIEPDVMVITAGR